MKRIVKDGYTEIVHDDGSTEKVNFTEYMKVTKQDIANNERRRVWVEKQKHKRRKKWLQDNG